jgi:Tfp pilus assembly major pilin PilA
MHRERGLSLIGTIFVLAILGFVAVVGLKLVPAYIEYFAVKKVLAAMVHSGDTKGTVAEIKKAFDRRSLIDDIHSLKGEDLDVTKEGGTVVVSANYSVKVPLVANVSACIDFSTSTGE